MARFSDLPALKYQYFPSSHETVPLNMQPRLIYWAGRLFFSTEIGFQSSLTEVLFSPLLELMMNFE
jgi:hypothetical protein